jgi:hypothetical protein
LADGKSRFDPRLRLALGHRDELHRPARGGHVETCAHLGEALGYFVRVGVQHFTPP